MCYFVFVDFYGDIFYYISLFDEFIRVVFAFVRVYGANEIIDDGFFEIFWIRFLKMCGDFGFGECNVWWCGFFKYIYVFVYVFLWIIIARSR